MTTLTKFKVPNSIEPLDQLCYYTNVDGSTFPIVIFQPVDYLFRGKGVLHLTKVNGKILSDFSYLVPCVVLEHLVGKREVKEGHHQFCYFVSTIRGRNTITYEVSKKVPSQTLGILRDI